MQGLGRTRGLTLIELMVATAIVAILSALSVQNYGATVAKARRKEAISVLNTILRGEKAHFAEHNSWAFNPADAAFFLDNAVFLSYIPGPPEWRLNFEGHNYELAFIGNQNLGRWQGFARGHVGGSNHGIDDDSFPDTLLVGEEPGLQLTPRMGVVLNYDDITNHAYTAPNYGSP